MIWLERVGVLAALMVGVACLQYGLSNALRKTLGTPAAAISWNPDSLIARPTLYEATEVRASELELGDTFVLPSTGQTYHVDSVAYHRRIKRWYVLLRQFPFRSRRGYLDMGDRTIVVRLRSRIR